MFKVKVKVTGVKVNVLLIVSVVVIVKSKRVAYLQLVASHVDHAAVRVEHVHNRCPFYGTVLVTTWSLMTRVTSDVIGV